MTTALQSLARNQPVGRVAMTGEITLTGEVFPVGGIREKLIAARRAGIRKIILPEDNRGDVDEVPEHVLQGLKIQFVSRYPELLALVFESPTRRGREQPGGAGAPRNQVRGA
jgi:ATP-dependent Lon protease